LLQELHLAGCCAGEWVKLEAVTIHGDPCCLGLAGPNEPLVKPLTNVLAFERVHALRISGHALFCPVRDETIAHLRPLAMMQAVCERRDHQAETMFVLACAPG